MARQFSELNTSLINFIRKQHIFFVGTAASSGRVNISPKGGDSLRVEGPGKLVWMNLTGSGNESAAHILDNKRMTLMFCSFEKRPLILRVYGQARVVHPRDEARWQELASQFPELPGMRQFFEMDIDLVQTSCGEAVPYFEFAGNREALNEWANNKGPDGIRQYWADKNQQSIDGFDTRILD
jgi:hypothetical protein